MTYRILGMDGRVYIDVTYQPPRSRENRADMHPEGDPHSISRMLAKDDWYEPEWHSDPSYFWAERRADGSESAK